MTDDYYGLRAASLGNQHLRIDYLAEAGPRIVRLFVTGSEENLLKESPGVTWKTPYGTYSVHGGHRLWHAPESFPRSYIPDDRGLQGEELEGGVRLTGAVEAGSGMRKSMEIRLDPGRPALAIDHRLENENLWPVDLAPWAITQLPLGGVAIFPQQTDALDKDRLLPNRHLVLWPYTSWKDERLDLNDDYILVRAESKWPPCKIGYTNRAGWLAYLNRDILFVKRFDPLPDQPHPDFGCNAECYVDHQVIETETVAPLTHLEPGQSTIHHEDWEFYRLRDSTAMDVEGVRSALKELEIE